MTVHHPGEHIKDVKAAFKYLKEGNERFVSGNLHKWDHKTSREIIVSGQKPFAIILTCSDSRTPPEIYFDQGIGNIFVIRNAGNFPDATALGSIEFGVEHLKAVLVVVVGHDKCGAVNTAHSGATGLSENLQKALDMIKEGVADDQSEEDAMCTNVEVCVDIIKNNPVIQKLGTKVIGAIYSIGSGVVEFIEEC